MGDNLEKRGPADADRVNVNQAWERRYWCKEFDCTEAELRLVVTCVGVMRAEVKRAVKAGIAETALKRLKQLTKGRP